MPLLTCDVCDTPFFARPSGPLQRFCLPRCRSRATTRRSRAKPPTPASAKLSASCPSRPSGPRREGAFHFAEPFRAVFEGRRRLTILVRIFIRAQYGARPEIASTSKARYGFWNPSSIGFNSMCGVVAFRENPHPRVVFDHEDLYRELAPLIHGGWAALDGAGQNLHLAEFDLAVCVGNPDLLLSVGHCLSIGSNQIDNYVRDGVTAATKVTVHDNAIFERLAEETIVPNIAEFDKPIWRFVTYSWANGRRVEAINERHGDLRGRIVPLVSIGDEEYPYAWIERTREGKVRLVLPPETAHIGRWLVAFVGLLAKVDPDRFPSAPDWAAGSAWGSPATLRAMRALEEHRAESETILASRREEESLLEDALTSAQSRDKEGIQLLLTASGDELVEAVTAVLRDFGFEVTEMDATHVDRGGARLEDLRITDPDNPGWIALGEIKGYKGGAKVNDVSQITRRPVVNYVRETGVDPSTVWHIVNVERDTDPSARRPSIPNDLDLEPLTTQSGALLDTRDLYRAWRALEKGHASAADIRSSLRIAVTRWTYDDSAEGESGNARAV